jgi:GH25 family lysozyme M1 (1,4-beta-N-acetylmuramidase)
MFTIRKRYVAIGVAAAATMFLGALPATAAGTGTGPAVVGLGGTAQADASGTDDQAGITQNLVTPMSAPSGYSVTGIDVSGHQPSVNWTTVAGAGADFAYAKATEGTSYVNSVFSSQYNGAKGQGMYAGAYAFARPDSSNSVAQADYFIDHAQFTNDGKTLPPMLDIEWPYTDSAGNYVAPYPCYGISTSAMVTWIHGFVNEVKARTGSKTLIYTNTNWWNQCTGSSAAFGDEPLFVANYSASNGGTLPAGWSNWTFWQYADGGLLPGDQDVFSGSASQLAALAHVVTGTASVYGVLGDNRMTFTEIDAASGHRVPGYPVTSTTPLPFTPISMATLNFNTILMNAADGHLYRVDISTNKTSLTFAAGSPTDLGTGWGSLNKLTYDGNGHLYGIIPSTGALRRYDIGADKPVAADITNYTTIATGFGSLQTLTATGPDWLLGSTSAGVLRSYHITSSSTWVGYDLDASGWGSATMLLSPGDGVYYYVNDAHAMYHYLDANPFDGLGTDIQYYTSDPVDPSGWSQVLLSAQPGTV